jgi:glucosylceramidase
VKIAGYFTQDSSNPKRYIRYMTMSTPMQNPLHAFCTASQKAKAWVRAGLASCMALAACTQPAPSPPTANVQQPNAPVQLWTTTADQRLVLTPSLLEFIAAEGVADIEIDTATRYQQIVGFGAAITDASAWLIQNKLDANQREALLRELFGRDGDGIGFDFARLSIGASDFSRHHYSLDDPPDGKPDPELKHFDIAPNREDVIPVTRQVLAINPQLKIMASPWSAPAWMKDSHNLVKGHLSPAHYDAFARYLLKYVQAFATEGIPVTALSVQNEPDFEPGDYPGMRMNAPERTRFIGDYLGPLLAEHAPQVQIFDWDHNWDKPEEPLAVLNDAGASRYISAVAWHCYGGDASAQSRVHDAYPERDAYMTECSGGEWEPLISGGLTLQMRSVVIGSLRHWARGVLLWNLALDENRGPHAGGCDTCRGIVTINSKTGAVSRTDDYYALAHVSRFVRRNAWRVASTETGDGVDNVAFVNADDGTRVLVAVNSNDAPRTVHVREGEHRFVADLPAKSVTTFRWLAEAR